MIQEIETIFGNRDTYGKWKCLRELKVLGKIATLDSRYFIIDL